MPPADPNGATAAGPSSLKEMLPWSWNGNDWRRKDAATGKTLAVFDSRYESCYHQMKDFADERLREQGWVEKS